MANIKITDLTAYTDPLNTDVLPIVDVTSDTTKKVSIADLLKNAGSGTAAAPGIAFDGDSNTGIYRPGADQLAISTNGQGRLFVDEYGNVGINNSSSSYALSAGATGTSTVEIKAGGTTNLSRLLFSDSNTIGPGYIWYSHADNSLQFGANSGERARLDSSGRLGLGSTDPADKLEVAGDIRLKPASGANTLINFEYNNGVFAQIRGNGRNGSPLYGDLEFWTKGSTDGAPVERMVVSADGKVGIGNSSPTQELCVRSTAGTESDILIEGDNGASGGLTIFHNASNCGLYNSSNTSMTFSTNGTERARITSDGKLGLGTSSPTNDRLHIRESVAAGISLEASGTGGSTWRIVSTDNNASLGGGYLGVNNGGYRFVISSAGNVGIGTTSPVADFVVSNGGADGIELQPNIAANTNRITNYDRNGGSYSNFRLDAAQQEFLISGSEKARIDSSGRLLVGTSTEGNANADDLTISNSGNCGMTIRSGSSNAGVIYFSDATSGTAEYDGYIHYQQSAQFLSFGTAATERARLDSSGRLLVGTSSAVSNDTNGLLHVANTSSGNIILARKSTDAYTSGYGIGTIRFFSNSGSVYEEHARIQCFADGDTGSGDKPGRLVFSTTANSASSPTERLRIDSAGDITHTYSDSSTTTSTQLPPGIRINNTDNTLGRLAGLHFAHGGAGTANAGIFHVTTNTATNSTTCLGDLAFYVKASGSSTMTERMRIGSDGFVTISGLAGTGIRNVNVGSSGNLTISTSDERLKENIESIGSTLNQIKQLNPVKYQWKDRETAGDNYYYGFIAQHVEAIFPDCVYENNDGMKGINYTDLIAPLTAALQEALTKIETLEAKVAALEAA